VVGNPVLGKAASTAFRQWALKLTTELGRVRDYDVILEWLTLYASDGKQNRSIQATRRRVWQATRSKLVKMGRGQWKQLCHWNSSAVRPRKLRQRYRKQFSKIHDGLCRDAARFDDLDTAGRHEFRRALRRWRYLRELVLRRREQKTDRILERLIAFQESLGEMQNCSVIRTFFSSPPRSESRLEIARLAEAQEYKWLKRTRRHLAIFLRQR